MTGKNKPPIVFKPDQPDKTKPRVKSKRFSRGFSFMPDQTVGRDRLILTNGPQGKFTYVRKPAGQVESVTSANTDGASATYDYNALNLIRSVTSGTQSYSLTYDAVGNLSYQSLPNGMGVTYGYDDLNRLTFMQVYNSATTLASYTYTLGASGNRIGVTETGGRAVTWIPDDLYRLTSEGITNSTVNGSVSYVMDNVGNRLIRTSDIAAIPTQTFSGAYDSNDRCTATGFTWDANGNQLTDLQGRTFTYDPLNRLTSVTGTGVAVSYVYNADNLRVKKINNVTLVTTEYHWDMANVTGYPQVLEELENGSVVCRYAYGPTGVLSQSRKVNGSWVTSYFGKDAQSVRFLMDESGNITDSWTWDAYGNLLGRTGTTNCALGFDGEYMEPETGLVYLRARWYDPATGRFVQMDSYEGDKTNPASFNKYVSFDDRPMDYTDPTGNISANTIDSVLPEAASGPYRVVMENTFTNLSGGDMFVYTDPIIRDQIKRVAVAQIGNQSWLDEANNKCSKFIYDVLKSIGKAPLKLGGWRGEFYNRGLLKLSSLKYPPLASQWADPSFDIPNWQIVTGGPDEAMPGDIIAESIREYSDASGHVGFVAGYGKTISADSTVNPPGTITESDFGFRRYPSVKAHGLKHNAVVRRFSSNRLFIF